MYRVPVACAVAFSLAVLLAGCSATSQPATNTAAPQALTQSTPVRPAETTGPRVSETAPTSESALAGFYRGKTVRILVGLEAGGGFDLYARTIARHLGRYIPGEPTVIVENMPGAGGMVALNHLVNVGPADGTLIGTFDGGIILEQLFGTPGVQFDAATLHYLGAPSDFKLLLLIRDDAGVSRFEDLLAPGAREVAIGAIPRTNIERTAVLLREVIGAKVKVVSGYTGMSRIRLAIENGEVEGVVMPWDAVRSTSSEQVSSGKWRILTQWTETPIPELPVQAPTVFDFVRGEQARQLLRLGIVVPNQFARPFVLPPAVPLERAQALQKAFADTLRDREFVGDAAKANLDVSPLEGARLRELVTEFLGMPSDIKGELRKMFQY